WRLMQDEQIQAAIIEASRKVLRGMAPGAGRAVHNLINDPAHKDHARALDMVLSRSDPISTAMNMADDAPDPQRLLKLARQTLSSAERRRKYSRIDFMDTAFGYP